MEPKRFWQLVSRKLANEATLAELNELEYFANNSEYRHFLTQLEARNTTVTAADSTEAEQAFALHSIKLQLNASHLQDVSDSTTSIPAVSKRSNYLYLAYALSFFLAVISAYSLYNQYAATVITLNTIEVPLGQRVKVILPDSSIVWLNAKSKFTFPSSFNGTKREVRLDGEGYFEVAHSSKPFTVTTATHQINVLGTVFNVNAYSTSKLFETTLLSGMVKVGQNNGSSLVAVLKPGEKFTYSKSNVSSAVETVNAKDYSTWKDGLYQFNHISFSEMINELEHYKDTKIIVRDSSILNIVCTGKFRQEESIQEILDIISTDIPFKYVYNKKSNQLILSSK